MSAIYPFPSQPVSRKTDTWQTNPIRNPVQIL